MFKVEYKKKIYEVINVYEDEFLVADSDDNFECIPIKECKLVRDRA